MAMVLAVSITFLLYRRMRVVYAQRRTTQVVAAATDLPSGINLTSKDVVLLDWPGDVPLPGSFAKADLVLGRPLIYPLAAKVPILERDLGVQGSGVGLSAKIPTGMRATAVRSNEIVGVAGFLYPGSHVDVLATYNVPGGTGPITQTVLQDVEVLTAGQTIEPDPQGKPQQVNVVTVLVSPEDSQKLQLASSQGTIQFVLRSGADQEKANLHPTRLDQLANLEKPAAPAPPPAPAKRVVRPAAPPKEPTRYVLEVIQGTKRTTEKFDRIEESVKGEGNSQ
jgi:pilus assembly protein CpaB